MMIKAFFNKYFVFLFFVLLSQHSNGFFIAAHASEYIDPILFMELPKEQQRALLSTGQMLLANLEQVQNDEWVRKNKYKSVQILLNTLLKEAYAQDYKIEGDTNGLCVYGGWLTYERYAYKESSGVTCPHPLDVNAKIENGKKVIKDIKKTRNLSDESYKYMSEMSKEYSELITTECQDAFKDPKNGKTLYERQRNVMVCNPSFFGTKLDGKAFCSVGNQNPYNSSYGCVQAANKYYEEYSQANKAEYPDADSVKAKVLDKIVSDNLKKFGDSNQWGDLRSLPSMLQNFYNICMCDGKDGFISQRYAAKMYEQRTCYAWLSQTKEILGNLNAKTCAVLDGIPYQQSSKSGEEGIVLSNMGDWANKAYAVIEDQLKDYPPSTVFDSHQDDGNWRKDKLNTRSSNSYKDCPIEFNPTLVAEGASVGTEYYRVTGVVQGLSREKKYPKENWGYSTAQALDPNDNDVKPTDLPNAWDFRRFGEDYTVKVKLKGFADSNEVIVPGIKNETKLGCSLKAEDIASANPAQGNTNSAGVTNGRADDVTASSTTAAANGSKNKKIKLILSSTNILDLAKDKYTITWSGVSDISEDQLSAMFEPVTGTEAKVEITKNGFPDLAIDPCVYAGTEDDNNDDVVIVEEGKYSISLSTKSEDELAADLLATVKDKDGKEINDLAAEGLTIKWVSQEIITASEKEEDVGVDATETGAVKDLHSGSDLDLNVNKEKYKQNVTATLFKGEEEQGKASEPVKAKKKEEEKEDKKEKEKDKKKKKSTGGGPTAPQPGQFLTKPGGTFRGNM